MPQPNADQYLLIGIEKQLESLIEDTREEAIKNTVFAFENTLRERIGSAAVKVSDYFTVSRLGDDVVIHCKFTKG